ncbi:ABC transporter ATP-binding protein [Cellulosilyticum lentocellum]|uniref:ABC transporter related protein n=1 Tax=Cellulosilyticum lentocellum (strain ATCC 49066 / DSM 5427 / NCIMB 11756 / RHM5) TaxID=642492 RepID=F2JHB3_CELLD|nr:ABC transporter ATP-binding protein [Cellulosilyticum lentocellum]ADZ83011.1 ABC transporter related protein [Cellulosilyticum lentocellum DSM 5427]
MSILEVQHLNKHFKTFSLQDITIQLEKGCIMGFIGENGSGKTTTIKLLLNGLPKDSGEIKLFGLDHIVNEVAVKEKLGYVPADDYFTDSATLASHAKALKPFYKTWDEDFFQTIVETWNLPQSQKMHEFSKGMKTKAMLALALAHRPQLLILDEPTVGLDPSARLEVLDILREFVADGERSVFLSTHITTDLDKIADYITLIHQGTIRESLSIDHLQEKYALVEGNLSQLQTHKEIFIGIRKGDIRFEGLLLRENALKYFNSEQIKVPNIENLLTLLTYGIQNENNNPILKGL